MQSAGTCCPASQTDDVVEDDFFGGNLHFRAVPNDFRRGGEQKRKFIDLPFCDDFLNDSDEEVCGKDHDEEELRNVGMGKDERTGDENAQQIEKSADVADKNARIRLTVLFVDVVEKKLFEAQFDLFGT